MAKPEGEALSGSAKLIRGMEKPGAISRAGLVLVSEASGSFLCGKGPLNMPLAGRYVQPHYVVAGVVPGATYVRCREAVQKG